MVKIKQTYCSIYIVRHGQTDWNVKRITQGSTDILLNEEGEKQARNFANDFKDIKFDAIFSSDLVRAKKTAEIIALEKKLAVDTSKLLRERRYGRFEGKPREEMNEARKIWMNLDRQQRLTFRPDKKYETDEEITSRLITFLREVAASHLEQTILVVAHGGLMRALLHHLSDKTYSTGAIGNSGYIKLESDGVDFFIKELKGIKNPNE